MVDHPFLRKYYIYPLHLLYIYIYIYIQVSVEEAKVCGETITTLFNFTHDTLLYRCWKISRWTLFDRRFKVESRRIWRRHRRRRHSLLVRPCWPRSFFGNLIPHRQKEGGKKEREREREKFGASSIVYRYHVSLSLFSLSSPFDTSGSHVQIPWKPLLLASFPKFIGKHPYFPIFKSLPCINRSQSFVRRFCLTASNLQ